MGWFDEQIKERKRNDEQIFSEAFLGIADSVLGTRIMDAITSNEEKTKNAISEILRYYHCKAKELPENIKDPNEQLEYMIRPSGIMKRSVELKDDWYKDGVLPLLAVLREDKSVVSIIPRGFKGYKFYDKNKGKFVKVTRKNKDLFEFDAICFYKPFPLEKISIGKLLKYIFGSISSFEIAMIVILSLVLVLVGMISPMLNNLLMGKVIEAGNLQALFGIATFMISVSISGLVINVYKELVMTRLNTKLSTTIEAASMSRVMSLKPEFFKQYSSGELSMRTSYINSLCDLLVNAIFGSSLTSLFSLAYIGQIFMYAPALAAPAFVIIIITLVFSIITTLVNIKVSKKRMETEAKESGLSYELISGIEKIKLAGAEKRGFSKWAKMYTEFSKVSYNPPALVMHQGSINLLITTIGTLVMYFFAVKSHVDVASYYAFNTSYGLVSGAFMSLASMTGMIANIKPTLDMVKPILEAVPEISEGKEMVSRISGGIELTNVSFRYNESMPNVIDNLSLKIKAGQYIAIVGETGCGKSTLMRILLGFEQPQKGAVYYDGKDIQNLDLKSLRQKIGVVLQNGKLFSGDIYSNIVITKPTLTMDDAWKAAETAGMAEDIRHMPMGMHTLISEGNGGISGGQRQRLMIARAIAPQPKILMFDEATSALDNITQKQISEALDNLKCTRIVIAHRLSTIKECDRIIYLKGGHILEDGTYDELIALNGYFKDLVERQRLDN